MVRLLAEHRWPFRLHATYDESIGRFLDVFEAVNRDVPFNGLRWFFDHAETITRAQPGADQGARRRHRHAAPHGLSGRILRRPLRGRRRPAYAADGADAAAWASRSAPAPTPRACASYNPWVSLYWMVAGKTVGGTALYPEANRLDRTEALRRYTLGSAWFSGEEDKKGAIVPGQLADLAVALGRLLLGARGGDQADRIGADAGRRQGRARGGRVRVTRSAAAAGPARLVAGQGVWRLPPSPAAKTPASPWAHARAHGGHGLLHRSLGRIRRDRPGPLWGDLGCECFAF